LVSGKPSWCFSKKGVFVQTLDNYLLTILEKHPDPKGKKGIHPFSPQRLDRACEFLVKRCLEIASALEHMHSLGLFHFDVKPAKDLPSQEIVEI